MCLLSDHVIVNKIAFGKTACGHFKGLRFLAIIVHTDAMPTAI